MDGLPEDAGGGPLAMLSRFRRDFHACLTAQVRGVVARLIEAGHWSEGDPGILVIFYAGYGAMHLAYRLADLPVEVLGRLRSDRVLHFPVPARRPGTQGRPRRHGRKFALADPATWPRPPVCRHYPDLPVRHCRSASPGPAAPAAHPPFRTPPRRRQNHQTGMHPQGQARTTG